MKTKDVIDGFRAINIEKNSGIFYSSYTFNAVMNPQSNDGLDYDMNEAFNVTLTVEMPEEVTQSKGGKVDGFGSLENANAFAVRFVKEKFGV